MFYIISLCDKFRVYISILTPNTVKNILLKLKGAYESYHHVSISEEMVDLIIELSNKYIFNRNQPDKAIDILDEACSKVNLTNKVLSKLQILKNELNSIFS